MDKETVIRKIKKCLALARSGEANEAASALRQAQALMHEYDIDHPEIQASEVREERVCRGTASDPVQYETFLAQIVKRAFCCELYLSQGYDQRLWKAASWWVLIGCTPNIDVAAYTLEILLRQLHKARRQYIKAALKRCGKKNKTARADIFCEGWVATVASMVTSSESAPEQTDAIVAYMNKQHERLGSFTPKRREARCANTDRDYVGGIMAGRHAELYSAVGTRAAPKLIGGQ